MSGSLLKLSNVEASYGPVRALRGVSFDVPEGSVVVLLGANGAGKSTTLKTISGLIAADKGIVEYAGERVTGHRPDEAVHRGISHVPEGREVFPFLTVLENLRMGAFTRDGLNEVVEEINRVFDHFPILKEKANLDAGRLSGGQQQMLAIGRALVARPRLMLLDEPSLGLSPKLVRDIFELLKRVCSENGTTLLVVEQNAKVALDYADHGFVLELGRVVLGDTGARLRANPDVQEFYLGVKDAGLRGVRRWKRRKTWR
ncbi:ABC transporter ATP-binding protein [Pseudorhodoplanes sp.]|uniref:ABC transporter ATP-binding protein n=1 Tax=Pseudorhodoplanes sp. TaxID=1934341 RepID=UPI003D0C1B3D